MLASGCSVWRAEAFSGGTNDVFTIATQPTERSARWRTAEPRMRTSTFALVTLSSASSSVGALGRDENVLNSRATLPPAATIAQRALVWLSAAGCAGPVPSSTEHACTEEDRE
jgi:hypothetical protein